jgi:DNA-binding NtrC family response regulator
MSANETNRPPRKERTLLFIVDDDVLLLDFVEISLQQAGYRTRKFSDPETALHSFREARPKPDLLVSDYAMGKMNGLELIQQCKADHAGLKTLLISGTAGAEILMGAPVQVDQFLAKPFSADALIQTAAKALQS